jgi:hypothetical protein
VFASGIFCSENRDQRWLLLAFLFLIGKGGVRKLTKRLATQGDISRDYDPVCDAVNLNIKGFERICCV